MGNVTRPTKKKLLDALKKHEYVKKATAPVFGVEESSVRRWCEHYEIDTEFEKKKSIVEYQSVDVRALKKHKKGPLESKNTVKVSSDGTKVTRRVFVFSDLQIPFHNKKAISIALQRCKDYLCDPSFKGEKGCVIIGDYMDYSPLLGKSKSRYPKE